MIIFHASGLSIGTLLGKGVVFLLFRAQRPTMHCKNHYNISFLPFPPPILLLRCLSSRPGVFSRLFVCDLDAAMDAHFEPHLPEPYSDTRDPTHACAQP